MKFLLLSFLLLPQISSAQTSDARLKFCQDRLSTGDGIQKLISQPQNQIAFENQGGFFGSGVCWWHSRFTRAAAYLAIFEPSLPRPSKEQASQIINHLRHRKGIVTVPGFRNLQHFTNVYGQEVLNKLGDWQRSDAVLKVAWVKGLSGNSEVSPANLEEKMDNLYEKVQVGKAVYQKLQMPGPTAHAWLVVGMTKTFNGYTLNVIDSNSYGGYDTYQYIRGMESFSYKYSRNDIKFVPYTGEDKEEEKLREKLERECQNI